jgi:RNA polymerase sigma-70 factor (ECF subfamily)
MAPIDSLPRSDALPWLYATARKVLQHEMRGRSRRARLDSQLQVQLSGVDADTTDTVVNRLDAQQLLDTVPPKQREALQLVEWEHLDINTAARVAGCSAAAFRVRLHRGRRQLAAAATSVHLVTKENEVLS